MSINDIFPVELLLEVFSTAVHDPSLTRPSVDAVRPTLRLMLAITHVCSLWRDLGLKTSTLWTGCVDIARPIECTKEILLRCGTHHVDFALFIPDHSLRVMLLGPLIYRSRGELHEPTARFADNPSRELVLSRARSLDATLPTSNLSRAQVFDNLKAHLPHMETISLQCPWAPALKDVGVFNDKHWMVRVLSLKHCTVVLRPKLLPFLEELRIVNPVCYSFPDLDSWLGLLAGLPQLRVFELEDSYGLAPMDPASASVKKVNMAKLERLAFKASEKVIAISAQLLDAIIIPPSCALTVVTPVMPFSPSFEELLCILAKRYNAYDNSLGDFLEVTIAENTVSLQTRGSRAPAETFIQFSFGAGCVDMVPGYHAGLDVISAKLVLQSALQAFRKPISTVHLLTHRTFVHDDRQLSPFFDFHLLAEFPYVRSVELNVESLAAGSEPVNCAEGFSPGKFESRPRMFWFLTGGERELRIARVHFAGDSWHKLCLSLMRHLHPRADDPEEELRIQSLTFIECTGIRKWQLAKLKELIGIKYGVDIGYCDCRVLDEY